MSTVELPSTRHEADAQGRPSMVAIRSRLTFGPTRIRAGIDAFRTATSAIRAEPGCVEFGCYADLQDPDTLVVFEVFESADALEEHLVTLHMAVLGEELAKLGPKSYTSFYDVTPARPPQD